MATLAKAPEGATVNVILSMAGRACLGQADGVFHDFGMTGAAPQTLVRANKWVVCLHVMIEPPECPTIRIVA